MSLPHAIEAGVFYVATIFGFVVWFRFACSKRSRQHGGNQITDGESVNHGASTNPNGERDHV